MLHLKIAKTIISIGTIPWFISISFNNIQEINISLIPVLIFTVDDGKNELEILDGE